MSIEKINEMDHIVGSYSDVKNRFKIFSQNVYLRKQLCKLICEFENIKIPYQNNYMDIFEYKRSIFYERIDDFNIAWRKIYLRSQIN